MPWDYILAGKLVRKIRMSCMKPMEQDYNSTNKFNHNHPYNKIKSISTE